MPIILALFLVFSPTPCARVQEEGWLSFTNVLPQYTVYSVDVSFYTLSKKETDDTPTIGALNTKLKVGRDIAVSRDLSFLLGKKVYIEKVGVRWVKDLMHKRYKNRVDILVPSRKMAKKLGVWKNKKLIILY